MTPKEKAKELITKYNNSYDKANETYTVYQSIEESHRCALIAVDEIINVVNGVYKLLHIELLNENDSYWHEVKKEIEKI
jgi:RecG-like helicase